MCLGTNLWPLTWQSTTLTTTPQWDMKWADHDGCSNNEYVRCALASTHVQQSSLQSILGKIKLLQILLGGVVVIAVSDQWSRLRWSWFKSNTRQIYFRTCRRRFAWKSLPSFTHLKLLSTTLFPFYSNPWIFQPSTINVCVELVHNQV